MLYLNFPSFVYIFMYFMIQANAQIQNPSKLTKGISVSAA